MIKIAYLMISVLVCASVFLSTTGVRAADGKYERLIPLLQLPDKKEPLHLLKELGSELDPETFQANLDYLTENRQILENIRNDLQCRKLRWELDDFSQRILFVPEERSEYATLFRAYCRDVIDYLLAKTHFRNPYNGIVNLDGQIPPEVSEDGVTVFLVHNLVKESCARILFMTPEKRSRTIELRTKDFLGEIGSINTNVYVGEDGRITFEWDKYTIWQNSCDNYYTALTVPAEETFHLVLRAYTHQAIEAELNGNGPPGSARIKKTVKDWMQVEEALVGGLVRYLLPQFLNERVGQISGSLIDRHTRSKEGFEIYKYIHQGIDLVDRMGYQEAIEMYKRAPGEFRRCLENVGTDGAGLRADSSTGVPANL